MLKTKGNKTDTVDFIWIGNKIIANKMYTILNYAI